MIAPQLYLGDCLNILPTLPSESANLVFVDPPYNIGIFKKISATAYLDWCYKWIAGCSRVLKSNGAFWISHSKPDVLIDLSRMVARHGRGRRNWITWDKYNGATTDKGFLDGFTLTGTIRSFQPMTEYLVWHADEGEWTSKCDQERGFIFEPLRAYLDGERKRAKVSQRTVIAHLGMTGHDPHFFKAVQWKLPLKHQYQAMRRLFNRNNGNEFLRREYEFLRREYEDLRREYEHLRYTFNNPGKVSSVWQIPPAAKNGFPTSKPLALMKRIIETTSNPGEVVLDPMMGSGTALVACALLGRQGIGIEISPKWFMLAEKLIKAELEKAEQMEMRI